MPCPRALPLCRQQTDSNRGSHDLESAVLSADWATTAPQISFHETFNTLRNTSHTFTIFTTRTLLCSFINKTDTNNFIKIYLWLPSTQRGIHHPSAFETSVWLRMCPERGEPDRKKEHYKIYFHSSCITIITVKKNQFLIFSELLRLFYEIK